MQFEQESQKILKRLYQDRKVFRELLLRLIENDRLFALSKSYQTLDMLVLHEEEGLQIRLHVYKTLQSSVLLEKNISNFHNHPWDFTSCILSGGYRHFIAPSIVREERVGSFYTLRHTEFHAVEIYPNTVTLLITGPRQKDFFEIYEDGKIVLAPKLSNIQQIDRKHYYVLLDKLTQLQIIDTVSF